MQKKVIKAGKLTWTHFSEPTAEALKYLNQNFDFHTLDLEDCASKKQRPKIDEYPNYLFLVLQVPARHQRLGFILTTEINVFFGKNFLVTVNHGNQRLEKICKELEKSGESRDRFMKQGSSFLLYSIIKTVFESTYPTLDGIGGEINNIEKAVFSANRAQEDRLQDIMSAKKDIINFRRIIFSQRRVLAELGIKQSRFTPDRLEVYFDDVVDIIEKLWGTLENYKDLIVALQETNESMISHNTNNVIKTLTIFSVIMLPLTLITGIYGMNITTLPFAGSPLAFVIVCGVMLVVVFTMILFFKWKRWI